MLPAWLKLYLKRYLYPHFPRSRTLIRLCDIYSIFYYNQNYFREINGEYYHVKRLKDYFNASVVFDVGANIGEWSSFFLSVFPLSEIHTFEPSKGSFSCLTKNLISERFRHNNVGVGSSNEALHLNIYSETGGINSLYSNSRQQEPIRVEAIDIITLDDYCSSNNIDKVDYIKIDVEGHELAVIEGCRNYLKNHSISIIQFEFGGTRPETRVYFKDIFSLLRENHYLVTRIHPRKLQIIEKYNVKLEYIFGNYLAFTPEYFHRIPRKLLII